MYRLKPLILLVLTIVFISSCTKDDTNDLATSPGSAPVVVTTNILSITSAGAVAGGIISDSSGAEITAEGICYSTSPNPTTANNTVASNSDLINFSATITGLTVNTTYYARAYAANSTGMGYGNQVNFKTAYVVGQSYLGGIIYYVDIRGQHGLVAAPSDAGSAIDWGCSGTPTNATDSAIGGGLPNTNAILLACSGAPAALACTNYNLNGNGWFLPSLDELILLYENRRAVGNLSDAFYWSSTEINSNNANYINFTNGSSLSAAKSSTALVRPVKAF